MQGRHSNREGIDPEVEVAAETFVLDHGAQVAVGRRYQPEIGGQPVEPADPAIGAGFEQAQQLDLEGERQLADLVEEQRAATGRFDQPLLAVAGAGERAFLVAEEFAFEQRFGHSGAVNRDKRPFLAGAGFMDGVGDQFLAGSRFAEQQYGGIGMGDAQHFFQHRDEGRRTPDQALRGRPAAGLADDTHGFDEIDDLSLIVANRRRFDIDMLFAARRVMQVQDALRRPVLEALLERARLAGLVAGHVEMMRDLVTIAPGNLLAGPELPGVGGICRDDPVTRIHDDARLGQAVEEGKQLTEEMGSHAVFVTFAKLFCQY